MEFELKETKSLLVGSESDCIEKRNQIRTLKSSITELQNHLSTLEQGRYDLLEQKSEFEIRIEELDDKLKEILNERDALRIQINEDSVAMNQSSQRELELQSLLEKQKLVFEQRLKDIHSILGLKFTTAVQVQVEEIHKNVAALEWQKKMNFNKMPKSFRVPLMHPVVKTV